MSLNNRIAINLEDGGILECDGVKLGVDGDSVGRAGGLMMAGGRSKINNLNLKKTAVVKLVKGSIEPKSVNSKCLSSRMEKLTPGGAVGIMDKYVTFNGKESRVVWESADVGTRMSAEARAKIVAMCKMDGGLYPGEEVRYFFREYEGMLEIKESMVASWAGVRVDGLFARVHLIKGEVIGVYSGRVTETGGAYTVDVASKGKSNIPVDACLDDGSVTMFGRMNEDIHGGEYNCELGYNGVIMTLRDIRPGEELLTRYGALYNWDSLKNRALAELGKEFRGKFQDVDLEWEDIAKVRESKMVLARWVAKLIDGKCTYNELHSVAEGDDWVGYEGQIAFLTSGTTYEKYAFRKWGLPLRVWHEDEVKKNHDMYAERWNELSVSRFPWTEVVKRNGDIRTLRGMYEEERRRAMRYGIRSDQKNIPAVTEDKLDLSGRKVGKVQDKEL